MPRPGRSEGAIVARSHFGAPVAMSFVPRPLKSMTARARSTWGGDISTAVIAHLVRSTHLSSIIRHVLGDAKVSHLARFCQSANL